MSNQRNISIEIPKHLLDQIKMRSMVHDRRRNGEFRYLVQMGLDLAGEDDVSIDVPRADMKKTTARMTFELEARLLARAHRFERALGWELVRMAAYAIQVCTDRDLKFIEEMLERRDRGAVGTPHPEQPELQPSTPA